ncbi:MAG TPA: hypothetical protein VE650_10755 [Acetobacteraceae bacterium]|nr:hypothetical protein [Acetobacteraceae bacterium]
MIDLSQETEALARRLAEQQNVTVDAVVRQALEARAQAAGLAPRHGPSRDGSPEAVAARRNRMEQIVQELAAMPILDRRPPQEIVDDINEL